ncbi:hypothetical protein ACFLXD_06640 [Chloroflexota bacterium]
MAHKQAGIIYHELWKDKPYQELGENFFDQPSIRSRLSDGWYGVCKVWGIV